MVQLEKILCLLFTFLIIYLVSQKCTVEGLRLDSFDNCIDDPSWFTYDSDGNKKYCKDISDTISCYDRGENHSEGWERCLKTCGNCSKTEVTAGQMQTIGGYSSDPTSLDYGMVLSPDDSRNWVGLSVGDDKNKDVRSTIRSDESEDILDIYDRLQNMESLYDMMLGSVRSCIKCEDHDQSDCENYIGCKYVLGTDGNSGACQVKDAASSKFISCNGSELNCSYKLKTMKKSGSGQSDSSQVINSQSVTSTSSDNNFTTQLEDGDNINHQYVKHTCDSYGNCSLLFPTYEFNCNNLPTPMLQQVVIQVLPRTSIKTT